MILLPGLDGTGELFTPLVENLPPMFEPVRISYANEPVTNYDELLPQVQRRLPHDEPFILVAESFSGPLAAKIAAMRPKNLEALILCATFVENPLPGMGWIYRFVSSWMFRLPPPRTLIRYLLAGANGSNALVDQLLAIAWSLKPEVIASRIRLVLTVNAMQALTVCQIPILYLRATRDKLVGSHCANRILQLNSQAKMGEIDAPHLLLQTEPDKAISAISHFLKSELSA